LLRDAVQNIYHRSVLARLPEVPADPRAELMDWCRHHHRFLTRIRSLMRTSMAEFAERPEQVAQACKLPVRIAAELHAYLIKLRARGLARGRWNARAAAALLMGAVFADATQRDIMPERYPYSDERAVAHYLDIFLAGIGATVRRPRRRPRERQHNGGRLPSLQQQPVDGHGVRVCVRAGCAYLRSRGLRLETPQSSPERVSRFRGSRICPGLGRRNIRPSVVR
jgi:hypothetical protein